MTVTSAIRWRSFRLHKDGNRPEEYEDAFAGNPKAGRFAIADGASESSFASHWAKILVEGFIAVRAERTSLDWLPALQKQWARAVDHLKLDWFGEEKRELGAFATFLGLTIKLRRGDRDGFWRVLAVGDCCVFQAREDRLVDAFPVSRSVDFGNRPALIGSRSAAGRDALARGKQKLGRWKRGDRFFLMTDALAEWFLRRHEGHQKPWGSLLYRLDQSNPTTILTAYVEQLRSATELRNDDVSLLVIDL